MQLAASTGMMLTFLQNQFTHTAVLSTQLPESSLYSS